MDLSGMSKTLSLSFMPNIDDVHADASPSNYDPFKFSHGLTGVDQPANYLFVNILIATALIPAILAISFRIFTGMRNDRRRVSVIISCHNHKFWEKDRYAWWGSLKRYFLYSPLWTKRHNRELRIPGVGSAGTLPTRPQLVVIIIYVVSNVAYCVALPEQPRAQKFAEFRGRCGALAAFNMIFTILFALRNNPFIWLLHISYDTFNLFHRWIARLVVLQSLAHVFAFMYNAFQVTYDGESGWHSISWVFRHSLSYQFGFAALIAMTLLMLHSVGPLRHAFYETFLSLHRIGIAVTVSGIYLHLAKHALPQLPWVYLFISLLALEPLIRLIRILYYNFSWKKRTWTRVSLEALPGEATRVTFSLPRSWNANAGSHVHIYLPRVALWSSHPFSVAWSRSSESLSGSTEKLPTSIDDLKIKRGPSSVSCVIRARAGMTQTLYNMVSQAENSQVQLWGAVEGPYGGYHSLDSYGTIVLFAAGVGITHQLSFVQWGLAGHNANTAATQKVLLVWCIPNFESIEWIRPWLEELGTMNNFNKVVRIRLYCSKLRLSASSTRSLPTGLDLRLRRCDPQLDIDEEILAQTGAMAVSVCGPGSFSDSVRAAVRRRVCMRSIDFVEEAFSY